MTWTRPKDSMGNLSVCANCIAMAIFLFFDCAGVRLLLEKSEGRHFTPSGSVFYFCTPDISVTMKELQTRGVEFLDEPHLIAAMEDHDLWMVFFKDPAGNTLALMQEAPKGYRVNA